MTNTTFEAESQAITDLANVLARSILPLFAQVSSGKPKLVGSGFLVSSDTNSYLVSAAHVFDELKTGHELFFYIEPHIRQKLSGSLRLTKTPEGNNRKLDRLDVGVLRLEGPGLPPYPKVDKYPLVFDALMPNALPRDGKQYLLIGFPESKSRANPIAREVASEIYSFRNASAAPQKYADLGVSTQSHVVLSFNRKRTVGHDSQIRTFPEPSGMSGSPVWLLYDENGPNDPVQTPVVGVAIEHHKNHHAIVATDIDVVLKLIDEAV
ncbi:MAG: trypsin-like peptidase domain-containing protein [Nitrospira sp.]